MKTYIITDFFSSLSFTLGKVVVIMGLAVLTAAFAIALHRSLCVALRVHSVMEDPVEALIRSVHLNGDRSRDLLPSTRRCTTRRSIESGLRVMRPKTLRTRNWTVDESLCFILVH